MSKYNKDLIYAYIKGEEIDEYTIEELEDDSDFMLTVIKLTGDKRNYNLCSDNVKKNYNFIKSLVFQFQEDTQFICNIVDEYLNLNDTTKKGTPEYDEYDIEKTELLIILCDILKRRNQVEYFQYKALLFITEVIEMSIIEKMKDDIKNDSEMLNNFGMGFIFIEELYYNSDLVINYYADKLIYEIIEKQDVSLEQKLHNYYDDFNTIEKIGVNYFLINYIATYDKALSSYISNNINLLDKTIKKMEKIKNNWDRYNQNIEKQKYELLIERVNDYVENEAYDSIYSAIDFLYLVGMDLKVEEKILKYDELDEEFKDRILEDIHQIDKSKFKFKDLKHYYNIKKIMTKCLSNNSLEQMNEKDTNQNKTFSNNLVNFERRK